MRRMSFVLAAAAALLLLAGPAAAQTYPDVAAITVSDTTLACPGDDFTVSGSGFLPGEEVDIFFDGQPIATVTADDEGEFTVTVTAPDAASGEHTIEAVGETSGSDTATVTCVAGAAVAFTGASVTWGILLLGALILVGISALVAGRRRARTPA